MNFVEWSAYYNVSEEWFRASYDRYCGRGEYTEEEWIAAVESFVQERDKQGIREHFRSMTISDFIDKEVLQKIVKKHE